MLAAEQVEGYVRRGPKGHMEHVREFRRMSRDEMFLHLTDPHAGHGIHPFAINAPLDKQAAIRFHTQAHKDWASWLRGAKGHGEDVPVHQEIR